MTRFNKIFVAIVGSIVILGFIVALVFAVAGVNHTEEKTCTVVSKESVANQDTGHEYRVYTDQCGTLTVSDTVLKMRFNSADTYGMLKEGETYDMTLMGFRMPLFSQFQNILEARKYAP